MEGIIRSYLLIKAYQAQILYLMLQLGELGRALTVCLIGWLKHEPKIGPQ